MVTFLLLQATLGAIGRQALPPTGCAAFLWSRWEPPQLMAMVSAEPATLRLQIDGKPQVLTRVSGEGSANHGLTPVSRYALGEVIATVEMTVADRPDLTDGAMVTDATVTIEQAGKDTLVLPAAGLIGCAPSQR